MVRSGSRPGQVRGCGLDGVAKDLERFRKVLEKLKKKKTRNRGAPKVVRRSLDGCFIQAFVPELRFWLSAPGFEPQPLSLVQ